MRVYVTARFKGAESKHEVEALCKAVREAKLHDFSFVRDVSGYKRADESPKAMWSKVRDEIGSCDMLLVDVSDHPTGGRLIEAGIAYAMRKPVIVAQKHGTQHKKLFDGIASAIITYKDYDDLSKQLKKYDIDRNYNTTDKTTLLVMYLLLGGAISWAAAQFWIPLAPVAAVAYWLVVRRFSATARAFDRIVIYIPLAAIWWAVFAWLYPGELTFALGWTFGYWLLVLAALRKLEFSL